MQRKLISNAAMCATIAHAITTWETGYQLSNLMTDGQTFNFAQLFQDRSR